MFVMVMISKFLFKFTNFCVIICFLTKLLRSGILFSTAISADFVTKPLRSGVLFSNSVRFVFLTRSVTSGIYFSNSALSVGYLAFKTNPLVSMLFILATKIS